jgi:ADP-ribosylglycohydrolase
MAAAISGAYLGVDAIPAEWQERLENRDYLLSLAQNLWRAASYVKMKKERAPAD